MRDAPVFRVLGTLQADRDGSPLPLPSRRQRAVLAALLTRAGRPVSADELVEAARGARLADHPKAALQTVLSRLRTTLGADASTGASTPNRWVTGGSCSTFPTCPRRRG
jgi:DNA-binding SARP family transcriptional activator